MSWLMVGMEKRKTKIKNENETQLIKAVLFYGLFGLLQEKNARQQLLSIHLTDGDPSAIIKRS
jgi:hypothetical protein